MFADATSAVGGTPSFDVAATAPFGRPEVDPVTTLVNCADAARSCTTAAAGLLTVTEDACTLLDGADTPVWAETSDWMCDAEDAGLCPSPGDAFVPPPD